MDFKGFADSLNQTISIKDFKKNNNNVDQNYTCFFVSDIKRAKFTNIIKSATKSIIDFTLNPVQVKYNGVNRDLYVNNGKYYIKFNNYGRDVRINGEIECNLSKQKQMERMFKSVNINKFGTLSDLKYLQRIKCSN